MPIPAPQGWRPSHLTLAVAKLPPLPKLPRGYDKKGLLSSEPSKRELQTLLQLDEHLRPPNPASIPSLLNLAITGDSVLKVLAMTQLRKLRMEAAYWNSITARVNDFLFNYSLWIVAVDDLC